MSMTIPAPHPEHLELPPSLHLRTVPVAAGRWRVLDGAGRVIGHVETHDDPRGVRYRARRFHAATKRFRDIGDFWSAADAVTCLAHWR